MTTTTQTVTNRVAVVACVLLTSFALLVGIVNQAQAAPIAQAESSGQTNVSAPAPNVTYAAAGARQASSQWNVGAQKTAAFSKCISGVGVPIGLVAGLASNPLVWKYVHMIVHGGHTQESNRHSISETLAP